MIFNRKLDLIQTIEKKSAFLFGARGTGKTSLIAAQLKGSRVYDLLEEKTYLKLMQDSSILDQENPGSNQLIVLDEIQKLPKLLDEVHRLIVKKKHRFLLTGSSSRKIKSQGVNLLGGRARELRLLPLTWTEIPKFNLIHFLNRGGLPEVYLSDEPIEDLKGYVSLYLREEIAREALTRRVENFARFLDIIALQNGEELHFSNLSSDSGVNAKTIENYIDVLEDTLLGFRLPPFEQTKKRKAITRSKFYLFDLGVTRVLSKRGEVAEGSELFGRAFEHFVMLEVYAATQYLRTGQPMEYWRTKSGFEVDLIVGGETAIEIKAISNPGERHLKGLKALREERLLKKYKLICQVDRPRIVDGIEILPWQDFLEQLWG